MSETAYNKTLGRVRLVALFSLVLVLILLARPTPTSVTLGFFPVALGEAVRFWAAGYLLKTQELVTAGPYRFTRNPLYLGRLLIFSGICIMARLPYYANLLVMLAGWAVFFGYYLKRKERVEPARLLQVHGEAYERYFKSVPALLPTLTPYPDASPLGWSSARMLRNREHFMVAGLLLTALFLLWRAYTPAS